MTQIHTTRAVRRVVRWLAAVLALASFDCPGVASNAAAAPPTAQALPKVPDGFQVSVFAREPLVRNPCAMAFDQRGRLFVGQGPQYRHPKPDTPPDRVTLLVDTDGDGAADEAKVFAEGFNNIQGLAWYGDWLWVANAPDLTMVRDTDGDDRADEYRRVFGGLGNLEHGLHGLCLAPDGRLYMTKGNSRGYVDAESAERFIAPSPFIDLWGMPQPADLKQGKAGLLAKVESPSDYLRGYHRPSDDWGTEGGVLRMNPDGTKLEVFARGMRNMWDMNFDADFNWVGTDQDQDGGDRILAPFRGAHFGWGHAWSPHWTGEKHPPTAPISGPVFHGSGTGVVYGASSAFPPKYRNVYFCADWLNRNIFVFRPKWEGSSLRNMSRPEVFAQAPTGRAMGASEGMLFDPTDLEFGPNGALWVLSWGHGYGAKIENETQQDEGRIYRITPRDAQTAVGVAADERQWKDLRAWPGSALAATLRHEMLPARRTAVQRELIRRGRDAVPLLLDAARKADDEKTPGAFTWLAWTLAQISHEDASRALADLNQKIQSEPSQPNANTSVPRTVTLLRIEAERALRESRPLRQWAVSTISNPNPRLRRAAVIAITEAGDGAQRDMLWEVARTEKDRGVFYATWRGLREFETERRLRLMLAASMAGQRRAALLALLERGDLTGEEAAPMRFDADPATAALAEQFLAKVGAGDRPVIAIRFARSEQGQAMATIETTDVPAGTEVHFTTHRRRTNRHRGQALRASVSCRAQRDHHCVFVQESATDGARPCVRLSRGGCLTSPCCFQLRWATFPCFESRFETFRTTAPMAENGPIATKRPN